MVSVRSTGDDRELVFFDGIANVSTRLLLPRVGSFDRLDEEVFPVPVDVVGQIRADEIELEHLPAINILDAAGRPVDTDPGVSTINPESAGHFIELTTPINLYVQVEGPVRLVRTDDRLRLSFDRERNVIIGAWVPIERPRTKVVTSADVSDVFEAISTFGSAMRTFGPERSYQTMRGHPPLLVVEESLHIPEAATPPETGVNLYVPRSYLHGAIAGPLIYYLGARLRPSPRPRLEVDGNEVARLHAGSRFADDCTDLLHRVLFLDCLTRTATGYDVALAELDAVTARLSVDWGHLYDLPDADRLRAYLDLAPGVLRESMPDWGQRAYVVPNTRTIETLPYLANDLASVRPHRLVGSHAGDRDAIRADGSGLVRHPTGSTTPYGGSDDGPPTAGDEMAIGDRRPIGLDRAYPATYRNRSRRSGRDDASTMVVVCNDEKMSAELQYARSVYDSRDDFPVEVRRLENLRIDELSAELRRSADFFHFIGHIDADGFECIDGSLEVDDIEQVGVETFFLNACDSMRQATAMVERGAIGGIATDHSVVNSGAIRLGETVAELLIQGMPLGIALRLVRSSSAIGHKYTVIGDPKLAISNTASGVAYRCEVGRLDEDRFALTVRSYLTAARRHGSLTAFHLGEGTPYYLNPADRTFHVDRSDLLTFLEMESVPVTVEGDLVWSTGCRERLDRRTFSR